MKWIVVLVLALAATADARPGGGQTYSSSGGGDSYSSSGGGGGYHSSSGGYDSSSSGGGGAGSALFVSIFIGGGWALAILLVAVRARRDRAWNSARRRGPQPPMKLDMSPLLVADPNFSRPVFEDFVYQLYAAAQRARHDPAALGKLAPYFSPEALAKLGTRGGRIEQVVIGSLRIIRVDGIVDSDQTRVTVSIEANLARRDGTLDATERWLFARSIGVATKPPERTRSFPCPSCGAPWQAAGDPRTCSHCNTSITASQFDWTVQDIWVDAEASVGRTLTGTVEEVGNNFPTLEDSNAQLLLMNLRKDDPNVTWDAFTAHVKMIYERLAQAWNAQDLTPVRGLVTSSMLAYMQFWIDEYKRQRLANKLDDATIQHIALAKVTRDKFFDAITVRVFAIGLDYTHDAEGKVVGGSRDVRREYTEYWTMLRSSTRRGAITTTPNCPNCGAPLAISNAGVCTHCSAEVESGNFDWVLSKIEQDDVYRG